MDLTITRQNLNHALASVGGTIPARTSLAVIHNVLFEAEDDAVWISATDLDVSIRVKVPAEVTRPGAITAPGKKLQELTRQLADAPVSLRARGEQLELSCGPSRVRLHGMASEEFPAFPAMDSDQVWTVSESALRSLVEDVGFATSNEESRPILNGICWQMEETRMTMVATNGHRLARRRVPSESNQGSTAEFVVPPEGLGHVTRLFDGDGDIKVTRSANMLGFRSPTKEVSIRLIEGKYPNYSQVIPRDNDRIARVDKEAMEAAVRRMAVIASDQTRRVKLHLDDDKVGFEATNPDIGEAKDELPLEYAAEPLQIAFNANYLLEILRHMPRACEVEMSFKSSERAATVQPVAAPGRDSDGDGSESDSSETTDDYLCLIMPLRLVD